MGNRPDEPQQPREAQGSGSTHGEPTLQAQIATLQAQLHDQQLQLIGLEHRPLKVLENANRHTYRAAKSGDERDREIAHAANRVLLWRIFLVLFVASGSAGAIGLGGFTAYMAWEANKIAHSSITLTKEGNALVKKQNDYLRQQINEIAVDRRNQLRARKAELLKTIYDDELCNTQGEGEKSQRCPKVDIRSKQEALFALVDIAIEEYEEQLYKMPTRDLLRHIFVSDLRNLPHPKGLNLTDALLSPADGRKIWLGRINLKHVHMLNIHLEKANLSLAGLSFANMQGAKLQEADINRADLRFVELNNSYSQKANLSGADLTGTNLQGADLTGANLRGAILTGAKYTRGHPFWRDTTWPAGFDPQARGAILVTD